jgi:hypothetical protein
MTPGETVFFEQMALSVFSIDANGQIWRHKTNFAGAGWHDLPAPRRAEQRYQRYLYVRVWAGEGNVNTLAHRLVWLHFRGEIPDGLTPNHENGDGHDNRPENLTRLLTQSEQMRHAYRELGHTNPNAHLNWPAVRAIRARAGEPKEQLAAEFGVGLSTIKDVLSSRTWRENR